MDTETRVTIRLTDRDIRAAQVNSGLVVKLPPGTVEVILRVDRKDGEACDAEIAESDALLARGVR